MVVTTDIIVGYKVSYSETHLLLYVHEQLAMTLYYIYIYIYIHIYIHIQYIHIYIHIYIYTLGNIMYGCPSE